MTKLATQNDNSERTATDHSGKPGSPDESDAQGAPEINLAKAGINMLQATTPREESPAMPLVTSTPKCVGGFSSLPWAMWPNQIGEAILENTNPDIQNPATVRTFDTDWPRMAGNFTPN